MKFLKNILSVTFILILLSSCKTDKKVEIKTIDVSSETTSKSSTLMQPILKLSLVLKG